MCIIIYIILYVLQQYDVNDNDNDTAGRTVRTVLPDDTVNDNNDNDNDKILRTTYYGYRLQYSTRVLFTVYYFYFTVPGTVQTV